MNEILTLLAVITGPATGPDIWFAIAVAGSMAGPGIVSIPTSKSGKPRHVVLTDEGRGFFATATAGKAADALVFTRASGEAWGKSHQFRPLREACAAAKIVPAVGFHILRHTYASRLALVGAPMAVIAEQLGHAGTRMTERHYAHITPSYVGDTVRALFSRMGIVPASNVTTLAGRTAK